MINNIRFKIITGKINKIPRILHFCTKNARLHNNTTRSRPGRGQNLEAEAKAKASRRRPRPKFWPGGQFGLEDLTSLHLGLEENNASKNCGHISIPGKVSSIDLITV